MKRLILLVLYIVCFYEISATNYYVGGAGASDNNPGTITQPFATIQKAASVAVAGDVVNIRAGTYRETVVPANSGTGGNPIIFQPDAGAIVIISGANTADGGWTLHAGNIYKKTVNLPVNGYQRTLTTNTTLLANQVFKDGVMMFEARWPKLNTPADLLDRTKLRPRSSTSTFSDNTLTDNGLPGNLTGARVHMLGWFLAYTRPITGHNGNTISYPFCPGGDKFKQYYYVTGKLNLLTQAKEWHYEAGTLYFFQEGGGSPTGVEFKARNWGFDLRGKSNITINRLQFFACEPMTGNTASTNTILDGIKSKYQNHAFLQEDPDVIYANPKQTGIKLIGANSVIRNSEIQYAASQGIWLGANCRAENNLITDISYEGNYGAGITFWDNDPGQVVTKNTMYRFGRSAIDFGYNEYGSHLNFNINMNDIYYFGMLNVDLGGIYGARRINTTGGRIHHNWVHDSRATDDPSSMQLGINTGIYFDQAAGPVIVDHNVLWNNVQADIYNQQVYGRTAGGSSFYNNTFATDAGDSHPNHHSYVTYVSSPPDVQRNNIYRDDINVSWGNGVRNIANVLLEGINPQFMGTGPSGLGYRLRAGSPAINAGIAIPNITDGSVGAPDLGAYEFGGADWVPGYTPQAVIPPPSSPPVVTLTSPANGTSFTRGAPITITANASDANGTITRVEFFSGATKLGEDVTGPYSYVWNNAPSGTHSITARATDNEGTVTTSGAVSITVAANTPPTVSITGPANNAQFRTGVPITVSAAATDVNGSVTKVEFFNGTTKIGEDLTSPYTFIWNNALVGTHALTAVATDNENNSTTSAAVSISVNSNSVPTVAITGPLNNVQFMAGAPITITATASDANGSISKVEFYSGTNLLGTDLTSPYSFAWNNATTGSHQLTAKATDNENNVTTSGIVNIAVVANNNPNVLITGPSNNGQFDAGTPITITASASDPNGAVTKVEFFNGTTKLGEDLTAPYNFTWSNAPVGSHSLTAKATDNQNGASTSPSITVEVLVVTVGANNNPNVLITGPSNNGQFVAGTPITITASASDPNGAVTKVEFFNGTTKLGEDLTAPYNFTWSDAPAGSHSLTAKATDNQNGASTSPSITIEVLVVTVGAAPIVSAGSDRLLQLPENSVTLAATVANVPDGPVTDYNWTQESGPETNFNPFQQEIVLTNLTEGTYVFSVTATNANGQHNDEVMITVTAGGTTEVSQGVIPRAFSPNGDGEDDLWVWPNDEIYANSHLTIMNQSGQIVYEKTSYDNTWDGTLDGKPLEKGQYQYTITGIKNSQPVQASVRIVR